MKNSESDVWERADFPPWSVKTLVIWLTGFWIFSQVIGRAIMVIVVLINKWFGLGMNGYEDLVVGRHTANVICAILILKFIVSKLNSTPHSLQDVWISFRPSPGWVSTSVILGILLGLFGTAVRKLISGSVDVHPVSPMQMDWRLALCLEMLAIALVIPVVEEIIFRGLFYQALQRRLSPGCAALLSSVVFTAYHILYMVNPVNFAITFMLGIACVELFNRTRSLTNAIACHVTFNATTIMVYYLAFYIPCCQMP